MRDSQPCMVIFTCKVYCEFYVGVLKIFTSTNVGPFSQFKNKQNGTKQKQKQNKTKKPQTDLRQKYVAMFKYHCHIEG